MDHLRLIILHHRHQVDTAIGVTEIVKETGTEKEDTEMMIVAENMIDDEMGNFEEEQDNMSSFTHHNNF